MKQNKFLLAISIVTILIGLKTIVGQFFFTRYFQPLFSDSQPPGFETAVGFVMAGYAFLLLVRGINSSGKQYQFLFFSSVISCFGLLELFQLDGGIDRIFNSVFNSTLEEMSLLSSVCFSLFGFALLSINSKNNRLQTTGQFLFHAITFISFIAVLGYAYQIPAFYRMSSDISISLESAILFFLISITASQLRPQLGINGIFLGSGIGNIMARKIFPTMTGILLLLSFIRIQAYRHHYVTEEFGITLFIISILIAVLFMIWRTTRTLNGIDAKRTEAESKIIALNHELEETIRERTSRLITTNQALSHEIEERKIIEEQLNLSQNRLMSAFIASQDGMWDWNLQTNYVFYSPQWKSMLGYAEAELENHISAFTTLLHPDDSARAFAEVEKHMKGETAFYEIEFRLRCKNGSYKWILARGKINEIDEKGNPLRFIGTHVDIEQRKKAEEEIHEVSYKFSKVFQLSPCGIAISVMEPSQMINSNNEVIKATHKVVDVNESFLKTFGYDQDEIVECYPVISSIVAKEEDRIALNERLLNKQPLKNIEVPLRRKDGKILNCILSAEQIQRDGKEYALWVVFDISERKEMELQLLKAKEMAERSAEIKEQFLANMSHEIRTPLNAIIGFTELLNKTALDAGQKDYVGFINEAGDNLLKIINEILDFSKYEHGKVTVEKVAFSIHSALERVVRMLGEKAKDKKLQLTLSVDRDIPVQVQGDPGKLMQILLNLVDNALKFTHQGKVHIDCAQLEQNEHSTKLRFSVKDTGIGIPADKLHRIFERFSQAGSEITQEYGGSGLGLAIAKQLVKMQGGELSVNSIQGSGSVFEFTLQYEKSIQIPLAFTPAPVESGQKAQVSCSVLVAEDNVMNQKFVFALLKDAGCEVDIAENGMQAFEMLKTGSYDLIMMDIQMPVLDGYHATRLIRDELKSNIPVIGVSAYALQGEKEKCLSSGMNDYLSKPYTEEDLIIMLLKYLPKKRALLVDEGNGSDQNEETRTLNGYKETPVTAAPVTDLSYLHEISKGNRVFASEMIQEFLNQNCEHLHRLEYAIAKKEFNEIGKTVHHMKNTVRFVGLHEIIGDDLRAMETLAETRQDFESLRKHFHIVKTQCLLAHEELRSAEII